MFGIIGGLSGIFTIIKIGMVAAPLLYIFSIVADYKSQAVKINNLEHELKAVKKQNQYWEGRYQRIVGANRNKKSALAKYEEAIDRAGCRRKVDLVFKRMKSEQLHRDIFGD